MGMPELIAMEEAARRRLGPAAAVALLTVREHDSRLMDTDGLEAEFRALAGDPAYVAAAREVIIRAAQRARAVQVGAVPYVADKAFAYEESGVVGRAARCALELDAPWVEQVLQLLADMSVAPTAAKTLPSQAVANAVARAIGDVPTPEAVAVLDRLAKEVRHASVKRRFARLVPVARKALGGRPGVGLRVLQDEALTAAQVKAWLAALEGAWLAEASWPFDEWWRTMHGRPELSCVTERLVWALDDGRSFRGAPGALVAADDAPVAVPEEGRVRLWHPVEATDDERQSWRDHAHRHRLEQPARQVFREYYRAGDLDVVGLEVDLRQLVGIARREGWTVDEGVATRRVGNLMCELYVDSNLYPGIEGTAPCAGIRLGKPRLVEVSWSGRLVWTLAEPAPDAGLPPVVVSEVLRSADLVVSASAVALDDETYRWTTTSGGALATRRAVLQPILAELDVSTGPVPVVGKRHVEVGQYRIHLTTARVMRDGEEVALRPVGKHGLWAPSEDRLLAKIVGLVVAARRAT